MLENSEELETSYNRWVCWCMTASATSYKRYVPKLFSALFVIILFVWLRIALTGVCLIVFFRRCFFFLASALTHCLTERLLERWWQEQWWARWCWARLAACWRGDRLICGRKLWVCDCSVHVVHTNFASAFFFGAISVVCNISTYTVPRIACALKLNPLF